MSVSAIIAIMAKTEEALKEKEKIKPRSPVSKAAEAMTALKSAETEESAEPIDLDPFEDPAVAAKALNKTIMNNAFRKVNMNYLETALAESEAEKEKSARTLKEIRAQNQAPPQPQPATSAVSPIMQVPVGSGILSNFATPSRHAELEVVLKSLESDEARLKFVSDHPELFNPSPLPFGQVQRSVVPSPITTPQSSAQPVDQMNTLAQASDFVLRQIQQGMAIQKELSSSQPVHPNTPTIPEIMNLFKEVTEKTTVAFTDVIKSIKEQSDKDKKELSEKSFALQEKNIQLQIDLIKQKEEYLTTENERLRQQAQAPPVIPLGQFQEYVQAANRDGIQVTTISPEQKKVDAEIARDDKRFDHEIALEKEKLEIEKIKEARRTAGVQAMSGLMSAVLSGNQLQKHDLSSSGKSIAGKW